MMEEGKCGETKTMIRQAHHKETKTGKDVN